jgi:cobalt-zinc-cadmium efflux system outer membrane protein
LTVDEAVQVALLNNPRVWAAFQRIGMARADVVQSGLLTNPTVGISFRFPDGGGLADFELSLAQNIADLWMIPARKRAAERDLDRAVLDTAREAASLAFDTKVAYVNAVASERVLGIAHDNLALVNELLKIAEARQQAGAVGALDVNLIRGLVLKAEVELRTARLEAASAKRTLATLLGLSGPADEIMLNDALPVPQQMPLDAARLLEIAADARLDLRAARHAVLAAQARVEAEYAKVFQNVEVGFELERNARRAQPGRNVVADTARASIANGTLTAPDIESRGQRQLDRSQEIEAILGPSLSLTLPIFDQNRAQIAKARYAYQESTALLEALERTIAQETREALDRATTAWGVAQLYETDVLPQARTTLELSEAAYRAGSAPILTVIDAQRSLLEIQRSYVAALQSATTALVDLERATARPMSALLAMPAGASQPSSSQPAEGSPPAQPEGGSK